MTNMSAKLRVQSSFSSNDPFFLGCRGFRTGVVLVLNHCQPGAFFCETSTEGGGYHPLPRFSL